MCIACDHPGLSGIPRLDPEARRRLVEGTAMPEEELRRLKAAVEEVDQSLTRVSDQSDEWVAYYLMQTGPWHRLLGMARGS